MKAHDLKNIRCPAYYDVVFEDADGNIHEIFSVMKVRYKGGSPKIILRETTANDFFFEVTQPPQELIDRLEKYKEKHDLC